MGSLQALIFLPVNAVCRLISGWAFKSSDLSCRFHPLCRIVYVNPIGRDVRLFVFTDPAERQGAISRKERTKLWTQQKLSSPAAAARWAGRLLPVQQSGRTVFIVAGIDLVTEVYSNFPIFSQPADCTVMGDVIVDFSHPSNLTRLLDFAIKENIPIVLATTGYSREQVEELTEASKKIPVFFSFNMSLGVNLLIDLAKRATKALGSSFDVEIIEKHHNQKLDAPSGTAIMLANAIRDTMATDPVYVYDRHSQRKKRTNNEIGSLCTRWYDCR